MINEPKKAAGQRALRELIERMEVVESDREKMLSTLDRVGITYAETTGVASITAIALINGDILTATTSTAGMLSGEGTLSATGSAAVDEPVTLEDIHDAIMLLTQATMQNGSNPAWMIPYIALVISALSLLMAAANSR